MAFNFIKRQLLKVIEWTDDTQNTILYRFDVPDRYAIMRGSQLTVRESQVCIFVVEGKIADVFTPAPIIFPSSFQEKPCCLPCSVKITSPAKSA